VLDQAVDEVRTRVTTVAERTARRSNALFWGLFGLIAASFLVRQRLHGLAYPPPWPDESSFMWPAISLSETGSLYAPEIHRARALMWMPPGYMVLSGVIFSVTGFSLEWARVLSALYLCGAFAAVAALVKGLPARWGYLGLLLVFLHSPIAMMAGNTARMETLVLLVAAVGFLLFARGLRAAGLSLTALGPLIHPNGVFALLGCAALSVIPIRGSLTRLRPRRVELVAVAGAAAAWIAYAVHVAWHYRDWLHDTVFQLRWKEFQAAEHGGMLNRLPSPGMWIPALIIIAAVVELVRNRASEAKIVAPLTAFAASLWLQSLITVGWLYDVYTLFMHFLVAILAVDLVGAWIRRRLETAPRAALLHPALALLAAVASAEMVVQGDLVMRSVIATTRARFWPAAPDYLRADDHAVVAEYLRAVAPTTGSISVNFLPDSDALAFHDLRGPNVQFSQPAFGVELADVYIFHESVWHPKLLRDLLIARLAFQQGIQAPVESWTTIRRRDQTEAWRVHRRRP
jgi:hypothetical protein